MTPVRLLMYRSEPPSPDAERQRAREADGRRGEAAILEHYRRLEEQLAGKQYLCGDFSVADIATFMVALFALRLKGPRLASHPALAAWYARVGARPAVAPVAAELDAMDRQLSPALYG